MKNYFKLFIVFAAFACNPIEENSTIEVKSDKTVENFDLSPPTSKNGVLEFKNEDSYRFWLEKVKKMDSAEFAKWENSLRFSSFSSIFDKLVDEEIRVSDSLTQVFNTSKIMPLRIHSEIPIHSKKTLLFLPYLYVFPEGGIAPLASMFENGIERLINENSEIIVGNEFIQFKDGIKLINGKVIKNSSKGLNLLVSTSSTGYSDRNMSTIGNFRTIADLTFTIRQSVVFINPDFGPLPSSGTNTWPEWRVVLRNFRQGFFGWNTRNTTSLRIEGQFSHSWRTCPSPWISDLPPFYIGTVAVNSGGSNTSAIEWVFSDPNLKFNHCYDFPISDQFRWASIFNLVITGEGNNVSNFNGNYTYSPN